MLVREERAALERAGLRSYFSFLPHLPEVASTLKAVDVVAIPSLWEAMPLLPMEAMVAGVPVVGTNCIGLGEILVDSPSAIVSPSGRCGARRGAGTRGKFQLTGGGRRVRAPSRRAL